MFSAKDGLNGPIKRIQSTGEVPQRTNSHDGRIRYLADRNRKLFLPSHIGLCSFLDSLDITVNKICFLKG